MVNPLFIDVPDAPALLHTDEVMATRITLYWLLDKSNGETKSVIIERRQEGQINWDRIEIHKAITTYTFNDVYDDTLYEFRLQAKNIVGLSKYSETQKLRTKKILVAGKKSKQ